MDLSIVIVSFNTKKLLSDCLSGIFSSLRDANFTYEVLVVDNGSTDGTPDMVQERYPDVKLRKNDKNVGFGKANNQAIDIARGRTILLLNSDTVVLENAIELLYKFSLRHPRSFIAPKLLNVDRTVQTSCGPFFTLAVVFVSLFLKGDTLRVTRWSPSKVSSVDWVSGAAVMAPKHIFLDGLLFDENMFLYMEEVDLLYRAKKKGYEVIFYPSAHVVHVGAGSSASGIQTPILNIYKGLLYFYRKHYGKRKLRFLKLLLKAKAMLAIAVGFILNSKRLKKTYEEAYRLV